ncbi:hypothetical protein G6F42_027316 [Rhizopus arrhizus]|nr:hypothetical protein G6F42_027316 [Rhizopus arrhizus]
MAYCRDEILPELDSVDQHVIRPSLELQEIIKTIQKTIVKRNHKLIDYDRHRVALQKLNVKTERTMNEEKAIFKVQSQLDTATQDYEYLNNALKEQLPAFFQMLFQLIQPIFEHMYNLQCKIYAGGWLQLEKATTRCSGRDTEYGFVEIRRKGMVDW